MDFLPAATLPQRLSALKDVLVDPLGRWHWRADRLIKLRHDRKSSAAWREMRGDLQRCGLPFSPFLLKAKGFEHAGFLWTPNARPTIFLPARVQTLLKLSHASLTSSAAQWSELLVLLHEWGHALLHPPHSGSWIDLCSPATRAHAHPAWAHVDGYLGWRVFNEMFADVFSAAWLLTLSKRDVGAVALLRHMRQERSAHEKVYGGSFPCLHPTAQALDAAMRSNWGHTSPDGLLREVLATTDQAFNQWLNRPGGPGKSGADLCASSLEHLRTMEGLFAQKRRPVFIYGRAWQRPGHAPNLHSALLLSRLRLENPRHPLLGFDASVQTLRWFDEQTPDGPLDTSGVLPSFL